MFCGKCGNKLPDGAAFCPNCGAPAASGAQLPARPPVNTAKPAFNSAQKASGAMDGKKFVLDKKQAIGTVLANAIAEGAVGSILTLLIVIVLALIYIFGDSGGAFTGRDILLWILAFIIGSVVYFLLIIGSGTILVMMRFKDPNDPAFKLGAAREEAKIENFGEKYKVIEDICINISRFVAFVFTACLMSIWGYFL